MWVFSQIEIGMTEIAMLILYPSRNPTTSFYGVPVLVIVGILGIFLSGRTQAADVKTWVESEMDSLARLHPHRNPELSLLSPF